MDIEKIKSCSDYLIYILDSHFNSKGDTMYKWYVEDSINKIEKILQMNDIPYHIDKPRSIGGIDKVVIKISDIVAKIREIKINSILND